MASSLVFQRFSRSALWRLTRQRRSCVGSVREQRSCQPHPIAFCVVWQWLRRSRKFLVCEICYGFEFFCLAFQTRADGVVGSGAASGRSLRRSAPGPDDPAQAGPRRDDPRHRRGCSERRRVGPGDTAGHPRGTPNPEADVARIMGRGSGARMTGRPGRHPGGAVSQQGGDVGAARAQRRATGVARVPRRAARHGENDHREGQRDGEVADAPNFVGPWRGLVQGPPRSGIPSGMGQRPKRETVPLR